MSVLHSAPSESSSTASRLLVVDDNLEGVIAIRDYFCTIGYVVGIAQDGPTALEQIAQTLPDVILLDLIMPGMDGLEVCRRLKIDPRTADTGVLLMTAYDELGLRLDGLRSGGDDYITKPFSMEELTLRVALQVRATAARRDLRAAVSEAVERGTELAVHIELLAALNATRDVQALFKTMSTQIARLIPHDWLSVIRYDAETHTVRFVYTEAPDSPVYTGAVFPADQMPYTLAVMRQGTPICVDDVWATSHPFQATFRRTGGRSLLFVPLKHETQTLGVFNLVSRKIAAFTPRDVERVQQLMPHLALAVAQAEQYEALQRAYIDLQQAHEAIVKTERDKAAIETVLQTGLTLSHEINNPLTAIIGFSELLYRENPERPEYHLMLEAGQRIADVVHRLNQLKTVRIKSYLPDIPIQMLDLESPTTPDTATEE